MNAEYLGDALDSWKGGLLQHLSSGRPRILNALKVDPMLSESGWTLAHQALYANLLGCSTEQIVAHKIHFWEATGKKRKEYFANIGKSGDIFLDPTTGVKTSRGAIPIAHYVTPEEILQLMTVSPRRIVVVYQHVRGNVKKRATRVLKVVAKAKPDRSVHHCFYQSGTVAMLFLSLDKKRIGQLASSLRKLLAPRKDRIVGP